MQSLSAVFGTMNSTLTSSAAKYLESISVLIIDDNQFMRKLVRNQLVNIGVKSVHEAVDGVAGLEAIRSLSPDIVVLDWEMPFLNGAELVRIVRSPGVFPFPDIPIIILSGYCERWRVIEAMRLGANEFLKKPISAKALLDRLLCIMAKPRPMVKSSNYYGPKPRNVFLDATKRIKPPSAAAVRSGH